MIFFVGAVFGAVTLAFTKEWGIMFATALVGAFLVTSLFTGFDAMLETLVAGGLFIVGGIVQVLFKNFEDKSSP